MDMDPETKRLLLAVVETLDALLVALELEGEEDSYAHNEALRRLNALRREIASAASDPPRQA